MFTSYFANLKKLPTNLEPVSIAVGNPVWYRGRRCIELAPTRAMLKMSPDDYNRHYDAILAKLDPKSIYDQLGENAVMLCWEKPGESCHRRRVAEWLESALGVTITEIGFHRSEVSSYLSMQWPTKAKKPSNQKMFSFAV